MHQWNLLDLDFMGSFFFLIIIKYISLIEIGQSWFLIYSWSLWKVVFDKGFVIFTHIVIVIATVKVEVTQLCLILCDLMDCTVHGILQARILEWVAFPSSKESSQPRDQTQVSHIAGGFFTSWATSEAHLLPSHKICSDCVCVLVTQLCLLFATPCGQ